jgi:hypothetical protein
MSSYIIESEGVGQEESGRGSGRAVPNWEYRTHPFRKKRGKGWGTHLVGGAVKAWASPPSAEAVKKNLSPSPVGLRAQLEHGAAAAAAAVATTEGCTIEIALAVGSERAGGTSAILARAEAVQDLVPDTCPSGQWEAQQQGNRKEGKNKILVHH